jgi:hypothetical protein
MEPGETEAVVRKLLAEALAGLPGFDETRATGRLPDGGIGGEEMLTAIFKHLAALDRAVIVLSVEVDRLRREVQSGE